MKVDYTTPGTPAAPTYDDNGNMTSDGSYGNRTYAYDTLGRLTSVTAAGATTTYSLDGAGNRWSQTTGAATTSFDLDLANPNPTILADGTAKYLAGSPGAGYEAGGAWQNGLTDLVGSPVLYVGTGGATSGLVHYDPYGVPRPGSTATTGIGYAGEYRDGTGLLNLRARSYDPVLGRFIGRDTSGGVASAPQTGNRYAYATANPLRYTDPSGHFVQTIIDNPLTVVEIAMTFNPVGAALVFGYQFLTGTDPASGQKIDPTFAAGGLAFVLVPPAVRALARPVFGALLRGLGAGAERLSAFAGAATSRLETAGRFIADSPISNAIKSAARNFGKFLGLERDSGTLATLAQAASRAAARVGVGRGPVYGTHVHSAFEAEVAALARSDLATEVSYLNGQLVPRGTLGSVRLDVVEGPSPLTPTVVYDLKTGSASLTPSRIAKIQANLPIGYQSVPVITVRP